MPGASVCQCLDRVHFSFLLRRKLALAGTSPYLKCRRLFLLPLLLLLCGDVELNPGPSSLILGHLNARSMTSVSVDMDKPELIQDVIVDANIGVLSVNETWLTTDTLPNTISSVLPSDYSFLNSPRISGRGGGVGFIYKSHLNLVKKFIPVFSSFEAMLAQFSICSSTFQILTLYRPPSPSIK